MEDISQLVRDVLEQGYLMSLATVDDDGVWVADVIYVFDDELNLYWMSDPEVRHSQAILKNNQVAGTITVSLPREDNLGIQFAGIAEKIDGPRFDLATKHSAKRRKSMPAEDDDVLQGDSWYLLRPTTIELICEKYFGFEKKKFSL